MSEKTVTKYNREKEWEKYCAEPLRKIIQYCSIYQIPCFFTVAVSNDENGTKYINDGVMTGSTDVHLTEDHIKYHMMVAAGCRAVATENNMMIDMTELEDPQDPDASKDRDEENTEANR